MLAVPHIVLLLKMCPWRLVSAFSSMAGQADPWDNVEQSTHHACITIFRADFTV